MAKSYFEDISEKRLTIDELRSTVREDGIEINWGDLMDKIEFLERAKMLLEEARNLYRDSGLISVTPFGYFDNGHVQLRGEKFREFSRMLNRKTDYTRRPSTA